MAMTHFLLQSNCNSRPFLQQTFHSHPLHNIALKRSYSYSPCSIKTSPKFNVKCFIMSHKPLVENRSNGFGENRGGESNNLNGVIWRSMENVIKALRIPLITGVVLGLVFLCNHHQGRLALAASGGAMGGDSFDSDSSSTSDYSSSDSSYDETYSIKAVNKVEPSALDVILAFVIFFVLPIFLIWDNYAHDTPKTSVLKLQIGSLGTGRLLQRELNRIAESAADTSTSKGFNYVLQEAIGALLRHSEYCTLGYSSVDVKGSVKECEKRFNQISIEERGKFDEETLVNVNNIIKKSVTSQSSNVSHNEYIVVTIIVAARGVPQLPPIKSSEQLKNALQKLSSIPSSNIMWKATFWQNRLP